MTSEVRQEQLSATVNFNDEMWTTA